MDPPLKFAKGWSAKGRLYRNNLHCSTLPEWSGTTGGAENKEPQAKLLVVKTLFIIGFGLAQEIDYEPRIAKVNY